jgi:hypothetical protein
VGIDFGADVGQGGRGGGHVSILPSAWGCGV